jgi:hypothetical protein
MLVKGRIEFSYEKEEVAKMVAYLLELDNRIAPRSLKLKTVQIGSDVVTRLEHSNIGTFFAAVDDLVFSERLISGLVEGLNEI